MILEVGYTRVRVTAPYRGKANKITVSIMKQSGAVTRTLRPIFSFAENRYPHFQTAWRAGRIKPDLKQCVACMPSMHGVVDKMGLWNKRHTFSAANPKNKPSEKWIRFSDGLNMKCKEQVHAWACTLRLVSDGMASRSDKTRFKTMCSVHAKHARGG
ncbi:hypothetical protein ACOR62_02120 [Neisseria lisongii]|uniref:Uncharacterized protein n=1 Tax=Neisseria lisongii TaxID=2912188 RepID=A0AAW5APY3_9NEIS|nr:hypothetical protein [Neisseria lisongii]MCF7530252.1 hypothetical protein [Neisseria lisongii]